MPPPKDETPEQREARLVKARKKAASSREEKMVEKYKNKVLEKVKQEEENENENENDDDDDEAPEKLIKPVKVGGRPKRDDEEASANRPVREEVEKKPVKTSARRPPRSKVIIEQSSDDEDIFEDKPNVIFVKRVRPKAKEIIKQEETPAPLPVRPPPQPSPQLIQQQQVPQRPPMTPQRRLELERYINMSQGRFLPITRPR